MGQYFCELFHKAKTHAFIQMTDSIYVSMCIVLVSAAELIVYHSAVLQSNEMSRENKKKKQIDYRRGSAKVEQRALQV